MGSRQIKAMLALALALAAAGCARESTISIPLQENAGRQYAYAVQQREDANLELIADKGRFAKKRAQVREQYNKVVFYFPGDRKWTPLAKLELIEIDAGLDLRQDTRRLTPKPGDLRRALDRFGELGKEYPEFEYIQAKTLFDQGLCHKALREYPKAQICFLQVRDRYLSNKNKEIRDLARIAGVYYNQTYTND